ncbi:MAG: MltA domain-containing protein [Pseudomonadota bacterium]
MIRALVLSVFVVLAVGSCQTPPEQTETPEDIQQQWEDPQWQIVPRSSAFDQLPGWDRADMAPGLQALRRSCLAFEAKAQTDFISNRQLWAGQVSEWMPACEALSVVGDQNSARAVIQALFLPLQVNPGSDRSRFTGYFEPTFEARLSPQGRFTDPVLPRPTDLVVQDGEVYQKLRNNRLRPYPARAEISQRNTPALAYMRPEDLFFLQIQGSGRLLLTDGRTLRAVYAANNGRKFVSTANWLLRKGWINRSQAGMTGIKAWMASANERRLRAAMNANPRYIFFAIKPEGDPNLGPDGSLGVPLTPFGSIAVDPAYHPLGAPFFLQTAAPGLGGGWSGFAVAQDTGGAIKGPVRADIYFGTGDQAGQRADTVNSDGALWILLPRQVANRIFEGMQSAQTSRQAGDLLNLP